MFDEMIAALKSGRLPPEADLKKRFDAAVVKKLGILKLPYPFWQNDQKINPAAAHLLWAAILLEDREKFHLVEGIINLEEAEKARAGGREATGVENAAATRMTRLCEELVRLAPDEPFRRLLAAKISHAAPTAASCRD